MSGLLLAVDCVDEDQDYFDERMCLEDVRERACSDDASNGSSAAIIVMIHLVVIYLNLLMKMTMTIL